MSQVGFSSLRWGFLCECCVEGERSGKGEPGKQDGAGERDKEGCRLGCPSLIPWGSLEHNCTAELVTAGDQGTGLLYQPPVKSVFGCGLPPECGGTQPPG